MPSQTLDKSSDDPSVTKSSAPRAQTLFAVAFTSRMSGPDFALLTRTLGFSTHVHLTVRPAQASESLARLDHFSGLFLESGASEGQWTLEGRSWGHPASSSVHEWHVAAAAAAHRLDQTVAAPQRLTVSPPEAPQRRVGRASNRRHTAFRRRLVGLD